MARFKLWREETSADALPPLCALTGEDTEDLKLQKFTWNPSWVPIVLLGGLLPYIIVVLVTRKSMAVSMPLLLDHHHHWRNKSLVCSGLAVGAVITLIVGVILASDYGSSNDLLAIGIILSSITFVIVAIILIVKISKRGIWVREIGTDFIVFEGLHPAFIDAVNAERKRDREAYELELLERRSRREQSPMARNDDPRDIDRKYRERYEDDRNARPGE